MPKPRSRTSISRGPPPRAMRFGTAARASSSSFGVAFTRCATASAGCATETICTWAVMSDSLTSAVKPPLVARIMRAAFDAAAMTLGLLDDHRHEVVTPVHPHVERDAERQRVPSEHVFDELCRPSRHVRGRPRAARHVELYVRCRGRRVRRRACAARRAAGGKIRGFASLQSWTAWCSGGTGGRHEPFQSQRARPARRARA